MTGINLDLKPGASSLEADTVGKPLATAYRMARFSAPYAGRKRR